MSLIDIKEKALSGGVVSRDEALFVSSLEGDGVFELFAAADAVRERFRGRGVDLCSIVNAKSGGCPENCSYCAQSSGSRTGAETYPLIGIEKVIESARAAKEAGARRFCIVTSGKTPRRAELKDIASMVSAVRGLGLLPCATLGLMDAEGLRFLKEAGLLRYHHNLETSERFFPEICTSHTYEEKLRTIKAVKASGLSLCSGGIFGLGEEWEDRVDMAEALRGFEAESVPINFLIPVAGTPLEAAEPLGPVEALKIISLFRLMLPEREIRVCGGRTQTLGRLSPFVFMAGADGLLIGNYLTAPGRDPAEDMRLIRALGLEALK